ncbi:MAG: hypothetical protein ACJZ02_01390 [Candidatus Neomarinimicrobiota bacterium]
MEFLGRIFGFQLKRLQFDLKDIKDDSNELIRLRLNRKDLFEFEKELLNSKAYDSSFKEEWLENRCHDFIIKGLIEGGIMEKESVARGLFLMQVIGWHMVKNDKKKSKLFLENRAWWNIYLNYAEKLGIIIIPIISNNEHQRFFPYMYDSFVLKLRNFPLLFSILKSIKNWIFITKYEPLLGTKIDGKLNNGISQNPKIFIFGRGDINLKNNGHHSDFFCVFNSKISSKHILYQHSSVEEGEKLNNFGFSIVKESVLTSNYSATLDMPIPERNHSYYKEKKQITKLVKSYNANKSYWINFFYEQCVKVYFTWYKYDHIHMAIADAAKETGGIFAVWQMAFDGFKTIESRTAADIAFNFSSWSLKMGNEDGSSINYNVITGYPKDYAAPLLRDEAKKLRSQLESRGARKIVFAIDENSIDDSRWHTGHSLQRENYRFILEKVLEVPWLGVVFKPKVASNLRERLSDVAKLLSEAENTGRCYVYEKSGRHNTITSPLAAGLSADVCIHGHLSAGTAALECAFEKLPTLLIDREGAPDSKLYELPKGKVIFKDWPEALDAVMEHFQSEKGISGFGDWASIIDELDPFRDGKAAYRMGNYLNQLISGFEKGLDRKIILENAAEIYAKEWGSDKIVIS